MNTSIHGVGYWLDLDDPKSKLPQPSWLPTHNLDNETKDIVLNYLRSGHTLMSCLGHSYCRFNCGIQDSGMGCRDFTDGTWFWPEGLHHYIEKHNLSLPNEFITHIIEMKGLVPLLENDAIKSLFSCDHSLKFWLKWSNKYKPNRNILSKIWERIG